MTSSLPTTDPVSLTLFCIIHGEETPFSVRIQTDESVDDLKQSIKERKQPRLNGLAADELKLYLVEITGNKKERKQQLQQLQLNPDDDLDPLDQLADVFDGPLKAKTIHIVVELPPERKRIEEDELDSEAMSLQKVQMSTIKKLRAGPDPSTFIRPPEFHKHQKQGFFLNGRPTLGVPIQLYHPVFSYFKDSLDDETIIPTGTECSLIQQFFSLSSGIYLSEEDRKNEIFPIMATLLGVTELLRIPASEHSDVDGVIMTHSGGPYTCVVSVANGDGPPDIQAAYIIARRLSEESCMSYVQTSPCPSFTIGIAGPWMVIQGGVFVDRVIIEPLTDYLWIGGGDVGDPILRFARLFRVLKEGLERLHSHYAGLPINPFRPSKPNPSRFYPFIRSFSVNGNPVDFQYERRLAEQPNPMFAGSTTLGQKIIIKFVTDYHVLAHRILEVEDLAPKLLYYSGEDELAPSLSPYHMVVMEYLDGNTAHDIYSDKPLPTHLFRIVRRAIRLLHENNIVFGDLRPQNIMISGDRSKARLIDFDWCGEHQISRYPVTFDHQNGIPWHANAGAHTLMMKDHDNHMLRHLNPVIGSLVEGVDSL